MGRNRIEVPVKKLDVNKGYNFYFNKQEGDVINKDVH